MPVDFKQCDLTARPFVHGDFGIRCLNLQTDSVVIHRWFTSERGRFWGMQDWTAVQVREAYAKLAASGHAMPYMGVSGEAPVFVLECYDPAFDELGRHYDVCSGDVGMHVFVGPANSPVPGFTRAVFQALMVFIFSRLNAHRIVVEPDVRNDKVHALNRAVGFVRHGTVRLPHKLAALAFCTREAFASAQRKELTE